MSSLKVLSRVVHPVKMIQYTVYDEKTKQTFIMREFYDEICNVPFGDMKEMLEPEPLPPKLLDFERVALFVRTKPELALQENEK